MNYCMHGHKSLSPTDGFELRDVGPPHPSLSYPGCLMGLLSPIILILFGAVNRLWYQLAMSDAICPFI
jgi:hypothetical protein